MFGVSLPMRYASASAVWPITAPNTLTRSSPVTRDRAVPVATTTLERSSVLMLRPRGARALARRRWRRPDGRPSRRRGLGQGQRREVAARRPRGLLHGDAQALQL